jgi:ATP synthase protein I
MPYNRPISDPRPGSKSDSKQGGKEPGLFSGWVQAEKLLQIAFVLPGSAAIGWLLGAWGDRRLHQSWMTIVGILLGSVLGLIYTVQMAVAAERSSDSRSSDQGGNVSRSEPGNGTPEDRP